MGPAEQDLLKDALNNLSYSCIKLTALHAYILSQTVTVQHPVVIISMRADGQHAELNGQG